MTALNCFLGPDAAYIATDGALYLVDGQRIGGGQKVALLGHLPCVIATSGAAASVHMMQAAVGSAYASFDRLVPDIAGLCRDTKAKYEREARKRGMAHVMPRRAVYLFSGWSEERQRIEVYVVSTDAAEEGAAKHAVQPWQVCPLHEIGSDLYHPQLPGIAEMAAEIASQYRGDNSPGDLPSYVALEVMERQRAVPHITERGRAVHILGGFCQFTTVTQHGITTEILRRWPEAGVA